MRPREHNELIFDVIPKLYDSTYKVFITNLVTAEKQLERLPLKFCKMYTTRPLANQLMFYLQRRDPNCIDESDFQIVEDAQPFQLRLSDGRRLEAMLCAGNDTRSFLTLLIRKAQGGPLLYFYSAVQQDDMCEMLKLETFCEWIKQGTDTLYLNLDGAMMPHVDIDYEVLADNIIDYARSRGSKTLLKLPLFGYEQLVKEVSMRIPGNIRMVGDYKESYEQLGAIFYEDKDCADLVIVTNSVSNELYCTTIDFPNDELNWSPVPKRLYLRALSAMLHPRHISGIVGYKSKGNLAPVPEYLKRFCIQKSPIQKPLQPLVELAEQLPMDVAVEAEVASFEAPGPIETQAATAESVFHVVKKRKICFVDDDDEDD